MFFPIRKSFSRCRFASATSYSWFVPDLQCWRMVQLQLLQETGNTDWSIPNGVRRSFCKSVVMLQCIWKASKWVGLQALEDKGYWLNPGKPCRVRTRWHIIFSWKPQVCMWRYTVGTNLEFLPPCFAAMIRTQLWAGRPKEFGLMFTVVTTFSPCLLYTYFFK